MLTIPPSAIKAFWPKFWPFMILLESPVREGEKEGADTHFEINSIRSDAVPSAHKPVVTDLSSQTKTWMYMSF